MHLFDGQPVAEALVSATKNQWSGVLHALALDEQIGMIVLRHGRIAWAVSKNQTEDFPFFLETLGNIPQQRLKDLVEKQKATSKAKKLGPLLEEAGLLDQAVLEKCLLAHIRSALSSLLNTPLMVVQAHKGDITADDSLTFCLRDCLESPAKDSAAGLSSPAVADQEPVKGANDELLLNLAPVSGYMYSLVAKISGELLAFHEEDSLGDLRDTVGATIGDWLKTSLHTARRMGIELPRTTFIEGVGHSLLVQVTDPECHYFLAVAFNEAGRLGVFKTKLSSMIPLIRTFTDTQ